MSIESSLLFYFFQIAEELVRVYSVDLVQSRHEPSNLLVNLLPIFLWPLLFMKIALDDSVSFESRNLLKVNSSIFLQWLMTSKGFTEILVGEEHLFFVLLQFLNEVRHFENGGVEFLGFLFKEFLFDGHFCLLLVDEFLVLVNCSFVLNYVQVRLFLFVGFVRNIVNIQLIKEI